MVTNISKYLLVVSIIVSSSCHKDRTIPCRNETKYSFNITSEVSNEREIYSLGDTVFLSSLFGKDLIDITSMNVVNYANSSDIYGGLNFAEIDTAQHSIKNALNKFKVLPITGSTIPYTNDANLGLSTKYYESSSTYEFSAGIVLLQKGIYYIAMQDGGSRGLKGINCTNAAFAMKIINANKHLNLFNYGLGYSPDAYLADHIYCFRVK